MSPLVGCPGVGGGGGAIHRGDFVRGYFCPVALLPGGHFWPGGLLTAGFLSGGAFVRQVF